MGVFDNISKKIPETFLGGSAQPSSEESVITPKIRQEAAKWGLDPATYLDIMNGASVYTANSTSDGSLVYPGMVDDSGGYDANVAFENTMRKYGNLDPSNLVPKRFGLGDVVQEYNDNIKSANLGIMNAVKRGADQQNTDAQAEVTDAQNEANRETSDAQHFFTYTTGQANRNNVIAKNELENTKDTVAAKNDKAQHDLDIANYNGNLHVRDARAEDEATTIMYNNQIEAAQAEVKTAEDTRTKNDEEAESLVNSLSSEVSGIETTISNLEGQLPALNTEIQSLEESEQLSDEKVEKLQKLKSQKSDLDKQISDSKEKLQKKNEELQSAKQKQTETAQAGQDSVNRANAQLQVVQGEADKAKNISQDRVTRAQKDAEIMKKRAEEALNLTKKEGDANIELYSRRVEETGKAGNARVTSAKADLKEAIDKGKKNVHKAKVDAAEIKRATTATVQEAEKQYHSGNVSEIQHSPTVDNHGTQAKLDAARRASVFGGTVDEIERNAREELESKMRSIDMERLQGAQQCYTTPPPRAKLMKAAELRYNEETKNGQTTKVIDGQEVYLPDSNESNNAKKIGVAGNNRVHCAVKSLSSTNKGNQMLMSHMYRDDARGVTVVHLQEAENNGKGTDGAGIYTFTDKEVARAQKRFGLRDGNASVYALATEQYLRENGEDAEQEDESRIYEIITGTKQRMTDNNQYINVGVNKFIDTADFTNKYDYETLRDCIESCNAAGSLVVATQDNAENSLAMVGVSENGNILVQDTHNGGTLNQRFSYYDKNGNRTIPFKQVGNKNGSPVYEMSKEAYQKFIKAGTVYKFKA